MVFLKVHASAPSAPPFIADTRHPPLLVVDVTGVVATGRGVLELTLDLPERRVEIHMRARSRRRIASPPFPVLA